MPTQLPPGTFAKTFAKWMQPGYKPKSMLSAAYIMARKKAQGSANPALNAPASTPTPTHQPPIVPGPPLIAPVSTQMDSPFEQTPPILTPQTPVVNDAQAFQDRQPNDSLQSGSFWKNALRRRSFGNVQTTPFGRRNPWLG